MLRQVMEQENPAFLPDGTPNLTDFQWAGAAAERDEVNYFERARPAGERDPNGSAPSIIEEQPWSIMPGSVALADRKRAPARSPSLRRRAEDLVGEESNPRLVWGTLQVG